MLRALWSASSGMLAQQLSLDNISNNIANVNTTGYKKIRTEFHDLLYSEINKEGQVGPNAVQVGNGVRTAATLMLFKQGNLEVTGNDTDFAISGDAFFEVLLPDGSTAYTRDGAFLIDQDGRLVTSTGSLISFAGGNGDVRFANGSSKLDIDSAGIIFEKQDVADEQGTTTRPVEIGRMNIVRFANPAGLERIGNDLYRPTTNSGTAQKAEDYRITKGALESSNVELAEEMTEMIIVQRAYELNSRSLKTSDEMLGMANSLFRR